MKEIIKETYVSFEVAKLLKEKGFDGVCYNVWGKHNNDEPQFIAAPIFIEGETTATRESVELAAKTFMNYYFPDNNFEGFLAPTQQMAMKWLREVHNIHVVPKFDFYAGDYTGRIYDGRRESTEEKNDYIAIVDNSTYEQACEAAIKYCLEKLI